MNTSISAVDMSTARPFLIDRARMFPFDVPLVTDDDLIVLLAYAAAEDIAEAERKAKDAEQQQSATFDTAAGSAEPTDGSGVEEECETASDSPGRGAKIRPQIWVARLNRIEGIDIDRMAPIHGRLIAHGFLQFQLQGREEGVVYRLTSAGRKAVAAAAASTESEAA